MVHIKEPLLLIGKSSPCSGGSGFPLSLSEWSLDRIGHTSSLCYTSRGALAVTSNSPMGPPRGINLTTHHTKSGCCNTELHLTPLIKKKNYIFIK